MRRALENYPAALAGVAGLLDGDLHDLEFAAVTVRASRSSDGIAVDGTAGPATIADLDRAANAPQPDRSFGGCPQLEEGVTSP